MGFVKGLRCKECGKDYEKLPIHVCEYWFGPLEVDYDYEGIKKVVSRKSIEAGPPTMWRYKEFMPIDVNANEIANEIAVIFFICAIPLD